MSILRAVLNEAQRNGVKSALRRLYLLKGEIRDGICVGTDPAGNKYYESPKVAEQKLKEEQWAKTRWVEYADIFNYDASSVPAEWHSWLHHMVDEPPSRVPPKVPFYRSEHTANPTGTPGKYVQPGHLYSSTYKPAASKVSMWQPSVNQHTGTS